MELTTTLQSPLIVGLYYNEEDGIQTTNSFMTLGKELSNIISNMKQKRRVRSILFSSRGSQILLEGQLDISLHNIIVEVDLHLFLGVFSTKRTLYVFISRSYTKGTTWNDKFWDSFHLFMVICEKQSTMETYDNQLDAIVFFCHIIVNVPSLRIMWFGFLVVAFCLI